MRQRIILLYLLLSVTRIAISQSILPFQKYLHYVNLAELRCVEADYSAAVQFYDSAFIIFPSGFAKDYYNSAVCFSFLKDNKNTYRHIKPVLQKGFSINILKQKPVFFSFFISSIGQRLTKEYYIPQFFSYNSELRTKIDSIYAKDQYFRVLEGGYEKYSDTIRKIDSVNAFSFANIIAQYGYPDESITGIDSLDLNFQLQDIIYYHQSFGGPTRVYDFTDILKKAMIDGKLPPSKAVVYIKRTNGFDEYGQKYTSIRKLILDTASIGMHCANGHQEFCHLQDSMIRAAPLLFQSITPEEESRFDQVRKSIGLASISETRHKVLFNLQNDSFAPFTPVGQEVYLFTTRKDYEASLQNYNSIK